MKKIAIFTRFNICNHGSILQTLATQEILKELGYESVVVNYINKKETFPRIISESLKTNGDWNKSFLKKTIYKVIKFLSLGISLFKFKKYRKQYINLTEELNEKVDLEKYDFSEFILCSGSDQLWGPIISGELDPVYYLSFSNQPKFAFSSSIGRNVELKKEFIEYLKNYKFITVRETPTKDYLVNQGIKESYDILDPTLLINSDYWNKMCGVNKEKKEYILFYTLHKNDGLENEVRKMSRDLNLEVIRLTNCLEDCFLFGKTKLNVEPPQFLSLIKNAKYVITDSFHCTVFSIIFCKTFMVYSPGVTSIRIESLLEKLDVKDRVAYSTDILANVTKVINYDEINKKLKEIKENNVMLLKEKIGELYEDCV